MSDISRTETSRALAGMTPKTKRAIPSELLDMRVGNGTLAGALNDQIRVRIDGTGDPSTRSLVPDNELTAQMWKTRAGTRLQSQLRGALSLLDGVEGTQLRGFTLNPDGRSLAAAGALAHLEDEPATRRSIVDSLAGDRTAAKSELSKWHKEEVTGLPDVAAWNNAGWIAISPQLSRVMLTDAGAYRPKSTEPAFRTYDNEGWGVPWLRAVMPHELQHTVTQVDDKTYERHGWLEEGIAEVLSTPAPFQKQAERRMDFSKQKYAGRLAHPPTFDVGWKAWKQPTYDDVATYQAEEAAVNRNYVDSEVLLKGFLKMAGAPLDSKAGRERAFHLLQDKSARYVPGQLADAIIDRHGIDPSKRESLRKAILTSIDTPNALRKVKTDFGIDS